MTTEISGGSDRLLRLSEVKHRVGFGKTTIYGMIGQDRFPRPHKPSPGAARWSAREIDAWIANVTSGRGPAG